MSKERERKEACLTTLMGTKPNGSKDWPAIVLKNSYLCAQSTMNTLGRCEKMLLLAHKRIIAGKGE